MMDLDLLSPDLNPYNVAKACKRALELFENKMAFKKIREKVFNIDHSWENVAKNYINVYKEL